MISPSLLSPAAVKIAALLPAGTNSCGAIYVGNPLHENDHQAPVTGGLSVSDKQRLFARYFIARQDAAVPYTLAPTNVLTAGGVGANDQENSVTLGDTYLFSATTVNSFRLFFNRISAILPGAQDVWPGKRRHQRVYLPAELLDHRQ